MLFFHIFCFNGFYLSVISAVELRPARCVHRQPASTGKHADRFLAPRLGLQHLICGHAQPVRRTRAGNAPG